MGLKSRDGKEKKDKDLGFTKEEEILLQDFSRNVSTKSSALFYGNAFIVSVIPLCKYNCIFFSILSVVDCIRCNLVFVCHLLRNIVPLR